ncbi:mite group 2 allergen-like Ixo r 2 [Amblyomma americanum]|uniref:MD-2-related lipid-recognition domain-containing protein n=1 Tax=Amblyomma americanum TaxID=6943 RepID=A0AAQ4FFB8_AMBAM
MLRAALFILAIGSALGQIRDAVYDDCGSTAEIISVQVEPCDSDPCVMKRGTKAKIHFEMVSDQDSETAVLEATTKLFGITVPVPGIEPDMCKEVVKCPIKKGQNYKGILVAPIPTIAPAGESSLTLKVKGDKGTSVCATSKLILE